MMPPIGGLVVSLQLEITLDILSVGKDRVKQSSSLLLSYAIIEKVTELRKKRR